MREDLMIKQFLIQSHSSVQGLHNEDGIFVFFLLLPKMKEELSNVLQNTQANLRWYIAL